MKAALLTLDSWRYDSIPNWFLDKHTPVCFANMYSHYHSTIPSLTSFYTGVAPQWHGIIEHHAFYKYRLSAKTIFEILETHGVDVGFFTDEFLVQKMQCVKWVKKLQSQKEVNEFLEKDNCLFVAHFFVTHSPYNDSNIANTIRKDRFGCWLNERFLNDARTAQRKIINAVLKNVDLMVPKLSRLIVSADHGEAFGEEGLYGHDGILHDTVLRIPFLIIDGKKKLRTVTERCYSSTTFDLILQWFNIQAKREIRGIHDTRGFTNMQRRHLLEKYL